MSIFVSHVTGFSFEGFHSCGPSVENLELSEIQDLLSATVVSIYFILSCCVLLSITVQCLSDTHLCLSLLGLKSWTLT